MSNPLQDLFTAVTRRKIYATSALLASVLTVVMASATAYFTAQGHVWAVWPGVSAVVGVLVTALSALAHANVTDKLDVGPTVATIDVPLKLNGGINATAKVDLVAKPLVTGTAGVKLLDEAAKSSPAPTVTEVPAPAATAKSSARSEAAKKAAATRKANLAKASSAKVSAKTPAKKVVK